MKTNEIILFSILKSALITGRSDDSLYLPGKQWFELFELSKRQGVSALVFDEVISYNNDMPFNLKMQWAFHSKSIKERQKQQLLVTSHLSELLAENGIKMMLLKGNGLALLYPNPECRECGDIDIYCFGDYDAVNQLVKANGIEIDDEDEKHSHFFFEDIPVENHRKMNYELNHANKVVSRELLKNFDKNPLTDERIPGVYFASLNINALYIMQHIINHLPWSGMPLRSLIDWMLFLRENHESLDWNYLESIWKESKEIEIVSILTQICIECVNMQKGCFGIDIQYDKRNYNEIYHQIMNPWEKSTATKCKVRKLFRKIDQYRRRKRAHFIVYKEPFPDSFLKSFSTKRSRRQTPRK